MTENHVKHAKIFKALSDEKRLMILEMLRKEQCCACKLLENLPIGQSTLSHHMKILCDSGIVSGSKVGKWIYYSIDKEGSHFAENLLCELTTEEKGIRTES